MKSFQELDVWKKSVDLCVAVYQLTKTFPKEEMYGITSQIRRCAVSIPSNIAEGFNRQSTKEYIQFLQISFGSSAELQTQLIIAYKLAYIPLEIFNQTMTDLEIIRKMSSGLIKSLKSQSS